MHVSGTGEDVICGGEPIRITLVDFGQCNTAITEERV